MKHLNRNKSKNSKATTVATLFTLVFFIVVVAAAPSSSLVNTALATTTTTTTTTFTAEPSGRTVDPVCSPRKAPAVVSGDNIYNAWWTNNTENGNEEVMFRASTDGGATFSNSTNLSNTTDADSWRVEIAGEGDTVVVSWWETNQTSDIPVARISTDAGETFGPMIMLAANGTLSSEEEEGEEGEVEALAEGVIEEAVGGPEVAE